jgi:hypothetical protein
MCAWECAACLAPNPPFDISLPAERTQLGERVVK